MVLQLENKKQTENFLSYFTEVLPCLEHRGKVELSNSFTQKRVALSKQFFMNALKQNITNSGGICKQIHDKLQKIGFFEDEELILQYENEIKHWEKRNWDDVLDYYLWSRREDFYDQGDFYGENRRKALATFINESGPPPRPKKINNITYNLGRPSNVPEITLGEVLFRRSNTTKYSNDKVALNKDILSTLLWHGLKVHRLNIKEKYHENILVLLNGYAKYFDIYLAIYNVSGIEPGIYFYDSEKHEIHHVKYVENIRNTIQDCMMGQRGPQTAAFSVFITTEFYRKQWRYKHERDLRNLYVSAARLAHNVILTGTALGLFSFITPAVKDSIINKLFELDSTKEQIIHTMTFGQRIPGSNLETYQDEKIT